MPVQIKFPIQYENLKKIEVLDKKVFKVCEIKEKEVGKLRKKFVFIHFDGKKWELLVANPDLSEARLIQLR